MKNKKYFILLFNYTSIQLFTEMNGKITNIDFANGKNELSNCVTFSYDREDLEFVPDGDPFEVNQNSPFSDYLDFAGYHFDSAQAIETIVTSIIENKFIPDLGKNDDIFIYLQASRYESNDETEKNNRVDICFPEKMSIKGHYIYSYDSDMLLNVCAEYIRKVVGSNILIGYPFITIFLYDIENGITVVYAPTVESSVTKKVMEQYPLPTNIPEKLLRNINNKIIFSKLLNLPLPAEAIYQNRKVDIAKTNLSKHFDVLLKEAAQYFFEKTDKAENKPTIIFDYGMHPFIKESFLSCIGEPIHTEKKDNELLTVFLLRLMMIQHAMNSDSLFKKDAITINKEGLEKTFIKFGNTLYFDPAFIYAYIKHHKKPNVFKNIETKELESLCSAILKKQ